MTITSTSIRLLESERMADTSDGGGRRTNRVVPDGVAGNVFPKVSRVDAVYGRVNLRKLYGHVNTATVEMYAGAHCIITDAPDNPLIGVLLFSTGSDYHVRADARDRIESYVIAGPESRMVVYGRQLKGASAVLVYQRIEEPLPEVGDVYCLSDEPAGVTGSQQFVRVQDVSHELRTFDDNGAEFQRRVVTLKIGAPLRQEFKGISSPSRNSSARGNTLMRSTTVADASRYFGIQPLTSAALLGALEVMVASVFAPIVPTTQSEAAVSLASISGAAAFLDSGTAEFVDGPFDPGSSPGQSFVLRTALAMKPGTISVQFAGGGSFVSVDDGAGNIAPDGGNGWTGTVDYANRQLNLTPTFSGESVVTVRYIPQAEVSQAAHTQEIVITLATRGTVYAPVLAPLPAPGSLRVQYRALGRWVELRDKGDGELVGDDVAYGTGLVDFITGAATVTLGALPDVGSSIILVWGSPTHYEQRLADTGGTAYQDFVLANTPVQPGELDIAYVADGTPYTVSMDANGVLSGGGASGRVDMSTGRGRIEYAARLPDFDSSLAITYKTWALDPSQDIVDTPTNTELLASPLTIGKAVLAASVSGVLTMTLAVSNDQVTDTTAASQVPFRVDGSGALLAAQAVSLRGPRATVTMAAGTVLGLLNAGTGAITYNPTMTLPTSWYVAGGDHPGWTQGAYLSTATVSAASVTYTPATYAVEGGGTIPAGSAVRIYTDRTEDLTIASDVPVRVDLTRTSSAQLVAGSVAFTLAGKRFIERSGTLYIDALYNGSATAAGTLDYATGVATPTLWTRGAALGLAVQSALIKLGDWLAVSAFFRTAGSPVRPASTYVQVTAVDGTAISGTTDVNGVIVGTLIRGQVEQSMGVARVWFGEWLPVAGNETQPWFDPANVVGSNVWKPRPVQPQTLRYSTVVLTSLPLSADILGLDPVRLPSDGRVPIYRPSDVAVIHHTGSVDAGTPTAGQVIGVGRGYLDQIWLEDSDRKKLAANLYAVNLEAGLVTMDAALSLAGYVPPIAVRHRIEEMVQISDVQINGQISLGAALTRAFPMGSQLSGALLFGDLFARVENVFDQRTWNGVWSDTLIGDPVDFEYDELNSPIEVLNEGAVNDRLRVHFTNGTGNYQLISENLGVIATGNISADIAPVNPLTGKTYVVIRKEGWGPVPWPVGSQLRLNTVAAAPGFWLARTVLRGATLAGDSFDAQLRGDSD
ncbi:hypothetical protein [Acidovorax sp. A1169]|uniref:hypothetical protein n=1 Tax=Acidovorax sp. A1169 TaxID=3059524 RepID=UPI002737BC5A|nr:hypothetical protein [Acidovorax sp. A1169]MDP4074199.1 hypothetical protein [Acidovorax sp. A1169]